MGRPPQEDYWLGKATERIFLPIMRLMLPEIVDVNMPAEGVFHNLVIVSIRKRYPGQARKVMQALWGMGLMMLAKTIVVVSEHVNVHDLSGGRLAGDRQHRSRGATWSSSRARWTISTTPRSAIASAASWASTPRRRGRSTTSAQAWPEEIRMSDGGARARDAALEGIRALSTTRHLLDAIKFEHTVFALPFAYIAMVLAAGGWPGWYAAGWVTAAMVGARTCAMATNRVVRPLDRRPQSAHGRPPSARAACCGVWQLRAAGRRRRGADVRRRARG